MLGRRPKEYNWPYYSFLKFSSLTAKPKGKEKTCKPKRNREHRTKIHKIKSHSDIFTNNTCALIYVPQSSVHISQRPPAMIYTCYTKQARVVRCSYVTDCRKKKRQILLSLTDLTCQINLLLPKLSEPLKINLSE